MLRLIYPLFSITTQLLDDGFKMLDLDRPEDVEAVDILDSIGIVLVPVEPRLGIQKIRSC